MKSTLTALRNLFVPNEENNFRARALHHDFLAFYLIVSVFFVFFLKISQKPLGNVLGFATDIQAQKLYELTNKERAKAGLGGLSFNEKLSQAAYKKAQDMFAKNYWAHYAPDGKTPWDFMYGVGYQYEYAGENLAKNFLFSDHVIEAWMNSSSHKENVLKKDYTEIGFAIVNGLLNGEETTLVVQMFGKPADNGLALEDSSKLQLSSVLAQTRADGQPIRSRVAFNIFWTFIAFLFFVLVSDLYFAFKLNLARFHGKNLAHLIFLAFVAVGVLLFFVKGAIL